MVIQEKPSTSRDARRYRVSRKHDSRPPRLNANAFENPSWSDTAPWRGALVQPLQRPLAASLPMKKYPYRRSPQKSWTAVQIYKSGSSLKAGSYLLDFFRSS